jgi:hypothetical protein
MSPFQGIVSLFLRHKCVNEDDHITCVYAIIHEMINKLGFFLECTSQTPTVTVAVLVSVIQK